MNRTNSKSRGYGDSQIALVTLCLCLVAAPVAANDDIPADVHGKRLDSVMPDTGQAWSARLCIRRSL